jgi:hypothetical protein
LIIYITFHDAKECQPGDLFSAAPWQNIPVSSSVNVHLLCVRNGFWRHALRRLSHPLAVFRLFLLQEKPSLRGPGRETCSLAESRIDALKLRMIE